MELHDVEMVSARKLAVRYNISKSAIHRHLQDRDRALRRPGATPALSKEIEEKLAERVREAYSSGYAFSQAQVQEAARSVAAFAGVEDFCASGQWLQGFKARHDLNGRVGERTTIARLHGFNRGAVKLFYDCLADAMAEFEARTGRAPTAADISNMDETAFAPDKAKSPKLLVPAKARAVTLPVQSSCGHVTAVYCGSADGDMMNPVLIMEGQRPMSKYLAYAPGFMLTMNEKGWMDIDTFVDWLHKYKEWKPGPSILVLDWHSSRNPLLTCYYGRQLGIIIVMLPPNTTHHLQPADQSFFSPLKVHFSQVLQTSFRGEVITKENIARIIYAATLALKPEHDPASAGGLRYRQWTSGFKACGIYPLNPDIIPDAWFEPADAFFAQVDMKTASNALLNLAEGKAPTPEEIDDKLAEALPAVDMVKMQERLEAYVKRTHARRAVIMTSDQMLVDELKAAEAKEAEEKAKEERKVVRQDAKQQREVATAAKKAAAVERAKARAAKAAAKQEAKEQRAKVRAAAEAAKAGAAPEAAPAAVPAAVSAAAVLTVVPAVDVALPAAMSAAIPKRAKGKRKACDMLDDEPMEELQAPVVTSSGRRVKRQRLD